MLKDELIIVLKILQWKSYVQPPYPNRCCSQVDISMLSLRGVCQNLALLSLSVNVYVKCVSSLSLVSHSFGCLDASS